MLLCSQVRGGGVGVALCDTLRVPYTGLATLSEGYEHSTVCTTHNRGKVSTPMHTNYFFVGVNFRMNYPFKYFILIFVQLSIVALNLFHFVVLIFV